MVPNIDLADWHCLKIANNEPNLKHWKQSKIFLFWMMNFTLIEAFDSGKRDGPTSKRSWR